MANDVHVVMTLSDDELVAWARKRSQLFQSKPAREVIEVLCCRLERIHQDRFPPKRTWRDAWGIFDRRRCEAAERAE